MTTAILEITANPTTGAKYRWIVRRNPNAAGVGQDASSILAAVRDGRFRANELKFQIGTIHLPDGTTTTVDEFYRDVDAALDAATGI